MIIDATKGYVYLRLLDVARDASAAGNSRT